MRKLILFNIPSIMTIGNFVGCLRMNVSLYMMELMRTIYVFLSKYLIQRFVLREIY